MAEPESVFRALSARAALLLAPGRLSWAVFGLACAVYGGRRLSWLEAMPQIEPDSDSYIDFYEYRLPGYPLFLDLHQAVFGGLQHLPQVQYGLLLAGIAALAAATASATRNVLVGLLVFVLSVKLAPEPNMASVMTETFYSAVLCFGAAAFIAFAQRPRAGLLAASALFVGAAAVTRSIGMVGVLALAAAVVVMILQRRLQVRAAVPAAAAMVCVFLAASTYNLVQHGRFGLGSYGGMSWLGHGVMVAQPLPKTDPLSRLDWVADYAAPAQAELDRAPSIPLRMLMLRLYYWHLRWEELPAQFDARWPGWRDAPLESDRAGMAGALGKAYIAHNPKGYLELVLLDYGALWGVPRVVTDGERDTIAAQYEAMGKVAYLTDFEADPRHQADWFQVVPPAYGPAHVWLLRLTSAACLALSALALAMVLFRRSLRASPLLGPAAFVGLAVHLTYAGTAAIESGLPRFVYPVWPLVVAVIPLIAWLMSAPRRPA